MRILIRCSTLFTGYRVVNAALGIRARWWDWVKVTVSKMAAGHHIYLVGPLPMPNIKTTDKVKNRSPPLRILSDRWLSAKNKFSYYLHQYLYFHRKTTRILMRWSPLFPENRLGNVVIGSCTRGQAWEKATVPTITINGFDVTGL